MCRGNSLERLEGSVGEGVRCTYLRCSSQPLAEPDAAMPATAFPRPEDLGAASPEARQH